MIDKNTDDVPRRRHLDNVNNVVIGIVVSVRRHTVPMASHQDLSVFDVLQSDPALVLWTICDNHLLQKYVFIVAVEMQNVTSFKVNISSNFNCLFVSWEISFKNTQ